MAGTEASPIGKEGKTAIAGTDTSPDRNRMADTGSHGSKRERTGVPGVPGVHGSEPEPISRVLHSPSLIRTKCGKQHGKYCKSEATKSVPAGIPTGALCIPGYAICQTTAFLADYPGKPIRGACGLPQPRALRAGPLHPRSSNRCNTISYRQDVPSSVVTERSQRIPEYLSPNRSATASLHIGSCGL